MPKTRLLLIEDDYDIGDLVFALFGGLDYEIFHAGDGREGIMMARSQLPHLVLLDVMLPDMNGWEVAHTLRDHGLTRHIPIIFLTQRNAQADKIKGLDIGADDYITKPFDIEELKLRVQRMINRTTQAHLYDTRTGLPGGPLIEAERKNRAAERGGFELRVRIEGLEGFRELYGFMAADEAFSFVADTLLDVIRKLGSDQDFVGVEESGEFVVFSHARDRDALQAGFNTLFNARIQTFYNFKDAERGYLILNPDTPDETRVPLMQLNITPAVASAGR